MGAFVTISHPGVNRVGRVAASAFPVWAALGWELVNAEDAYLVEAAPQSPVAIGDQFVADRIADEGSKVSAAIAAKVGGVLGVARDESDSEWPFTSGSFVSVIPGMSVTIPPVTRPVRLEYHAYGKITQVGTGIFGYTIYETTGGGSGVDVGGNSISLLDKTGVFEALRHFVGATVIAPLAVPIWRTFRLKGGLFIQSGSTGTAVTSKSGATKSRSAHITAVQL